MTKVKIGTLVPLRNLGLSICDTNSNWTQDYNQKSHTVIDIAFLICI